MSGRYRVGRDYRDDRKFVMNLNPAAGESGS